MRLKMSSSVLASPYESHRDIFHIEYEPNSTEFKLVRQNFNYIGNQILIGYYKMNSIYPVIEVLWNWVKKINLVIDLQDMVMILLLITVCLYFVLDDFTAFSKSNVKQISRDSKLKELSTKVSSKAEPVSKKSDSLMLHRYHNSTFRHKKNLPDHYYIHYKRFKYEIEPEVDPLELQQPSNANEDLMVSPYMSILCMFFGMTYLIRMF